MGIVTNNGCHEYSRRPTVLNQQYGHKFGQHRNFAIHCLTGQQ